MIGASDVLSQEEADAANQMAEELREIVDGQQCDLAMAALASVLLATVLNHADGDVDEAVAIMKGLAEDLTETLEQSEHQIAAMRQGGPN